MVEIIEVTQAQPGCQNEACGPPTLEAGAKSESAGMAPGRKHAGQTCSVTRLNGREASLTVAHEVERNAASGLGPKAAE